MFKDDHGLSLRLPESLAYMLLSLGGMTFALLLAVSIFVSPPAFAAFTKPGQDLTYDKKEVNRGVDHGTRARETVQNTKKGKQAIDQDLADKNKGTKNRIRRSNANNRQSAITSTTRMTPTGAITKAGVDLIKFFTGGGGLFTMEFLNLFVKDVLSFFAPSLGLTGSQLQSIVGPVETCAGKDADSSTPSTDESRYGPCPSGDCGNAKSPGYQRNNIARQSSFENFFASLNPCKG
ncbi:MAG: hypothetical protein V1495_05205 [Pseudomonadota bacterium]